MPHADESSRQARRKIWLPFVIAGGLMTVAVAALLTSGMVSTNLLYAADAPANDPFKVPDGDEAALVSFIEKIEAMQAPNTSQEDVIEFARKSRGAMLAAADKILAGKPDSEQRLIAINAKREGLGYQAFLSDDANFKPLEEFAAWLKDQKEDKLAEEATLLRLSVMAQVLSRTDGERRWQVLDKLVTDLTAQPVDRIRARIAMMAAQELEQLPDGQKGADACSKLGDYLATSDNKQIVAVGQQLMGTARRLNLMGNKFVDFSGTAMNGSSFNLEQYKGKVVLVDFWATWCGPCVAEIPNVRAAYRKYHDKGLEIVGVSIDEDRAALAQFIKGNDIPWPTLLASETKSGGDSAPLPDYYGVSMVPTVILIGKDGKVVSLMARGPQLHEMLEELLGPAS